jgi:hypothetical protein
MFCTHVGDEGARAIREAIQGNKGTKLASLNMGSINTGLFAIAGKISDYRFDW